MLGSVIIGLVMVVSVIMAVNLPHEQKEGNNELLFEQMSQLKKMLAHDKKIINTHRQNYVNQIYNIVKKHESTLYAKYCQLVTTDDYGYIRYDDYIKELNNFVKNIVLNIELSNHSPLDDMSLQNAFDKIESIVLNAPSERTICVYAECELPVFEADFFNFYITASTSVQNTMKIAEVYFRIAEDVYFKMLDEIDTDRESIVVRSSLSWYEKDWELKQGRLEIYRYLNARNIVEEIVFSLYVPKWEGINTKPKKLTPLDYEKHIAAQLKSLGFTARTTKASGDQGADVLAQKNGVSFAIQCKKYSKPVGNKAIQEANAGRDFYKKDYGVVVSNSTFTKSAKQAAHACGVILLNDNQLDDLLKYTDK